MRTEQLYYVIAVVKTGSFSKAAEQLYIKQQSLRTAIISLEEELGVTLFIRTPKGTILTPKGQEYLEKFEEILKIYDSIRQSPNLVDILRFGVNGFGSEYIVQTLYKFSERYPSLQINIVEKENPCALVQGILDDEFDFVITTVAKNLITEELFFIKNINKTILFQQLYEISVGIYVHKDHPFASLKYLEMRQLQGWPIITFAQRFIDEYINKIIAPEHVTCNVVSNNIEIVRLYAYQKQAIILSVQDVFQNDPEFIYIPFKENIPLVFGLMCKKNLSPELQMYYDFIIQQVFH